jgi:hypothetical protein
MSPQVSSPVKRPRLNAAQTLGKSLGGHIRSGCVRDHAPELVKANSVKQRRFHWESPPKKGEMDANRGMVIAALVGTRSNWEVLQNSILLRSC